MAIVREERSLTTRNSNTRKSAKVILSMAAAMGIAARGTPGVDPCAPGSFNAGVCKVALQHHGYCSGGAWVPMKYSQTYPNYYDSYQAYLSTGGLAVSAPEGDCGHRGRSTYFGTHGGFGATGSGRHSGG
jgi:hypothetical protein